MGKWDEQIADVYNKIVQRQPFEYSTEDDMLYKMYEQKYTQQGKQAMRDSMGQAAALTGGYGSSYGQAVGQQNYDAYMQELNALLPELFDRAYQQYAAEGDRLTQQYGLLTDMDSRDYNRFATQYGMNVDAYNRLMNEAAVLGAAGDFSKYKEIFGEDSANRMSQLFNAETLMPLYQAGVMDAEMYKSLTGSYPVGYNSNPVTVNTGWEGNWYGNDPETEKTLTAQELVQQAHNAYTVGDITASQRDDIINAAWGRSDKE